MLFQTSILISYSLQVWLKNIFKKSVLFKIRYQIGRYLSGNKVPRGIMSPVLQRIRGIKRARIVP